MEIVERDSRTASLPRKIVSTSLQKHGAILFRGFPLSTAVDFNEFIHAFEWKFGSYCGGGGPRNVVIGPVHTSTETPPNLNIPFHHELAYLTTAPSKLFFFCELPTTKDGETPILLSEKVIDYLEENNPEFLKQVSEKGIRYKRVISDRAVCDNQYQRSWQDVFETDDPNEANKRAEATGNEPLEWRDDARGVGAKTCIVTSRILPGVKIEPRTGARTWFNSVFLLHPRGDPEKSKLYHTTFGDGSEIQISDLDSVAKAFDTQGTKFLWHKGDVLLIDNTLALHARASFVGPRRILAAIVE